MRPTYRVGSSAWPRRPPYASGGLGATGKRPLSLKGKSEAKPRSPRLPL